MDIRRMREKISGAYRKLDMNRRCAYCGDPATGYDHFLPIAFVAALVQCGVGVSKRGKVLIACCKDCNYIAGAKLFPSIAAKRRYIRKRLIQKNAGLLNMPIWYEREFKEIGPSLETAIRHGQFKREWLLARIQWRNPETLKL
jgi:hypothetical protein